MIKTVIENPHLIIVVALATIVLGVTSYQQIPADLLPIFETPAVQIVTFYPGMPPEVMERDVMSRLERWTGQSVGIEHQEVEHLSLTGWSPVARVLAYRCESMQFWRKFSDDLDCPRSKC